MKLTILLTAVCLMLAACATAGKINQLEVGMTKAETVKLMGPPSSTSAKQGVEFMTYSLFETDTAARYGWATPYFVKIVDGKIDSFGRKGDFNSTVQPQSTLNLNVKTSSTDP